MKFKQVIFNSIIWRGLYFISTVIINIVIARLLGAIESGAIYYLSNFLAFILLIAGCSLESAFLFFGARDTIDVRRLAILGVVWAILVSVVLLVGTLLIYPINGLHYTQADLILYTLCYITGIILTNYFAYLYYSKQEYGLPNIILSVTSLFLIFFLVFSPVSTNGGFEVIIKAYFLNFLVQGILLGISWYFQNGKPFSWNLPSYKEIKQIFQYAISMLFVGFVFFLLYRIDYWFVKITCKVCKPGDLGNYIQVSKFSQLFLVLPGMLANAIFPRTAAGFKKEVNYWLPTISKFLFLLYLLISVLLVFIGSWFFPWVFGDSFNKMYLPFLLSIPGLLSLSTIALLVAYNAGKDNVKTNIYAALIGLFVIVPGDLLIIPGFGIQGAALVSSAGYIASLGYLLRSFKWQYGVSGKYFFMPVVEDFNIFRKLIALVKNN